MLVSLCNIKTHKVTALTSLQISPDDVPELRLAGQPVYPGQDAAAPHTPGQHVSAAGQT